MHGVRRTAMAEGAAAPAHMITFAPSSRKLVVARADGDIAILEIDNSNNVTVARVWDRRPTGPDEGACALLIVSASGFGRPSTASQSCLSLCVLSWLTPSRRRPPLCFLRRRERRDGAPRNGVLARDLGRWAVAGCWRPGELLDGVQPRHPAGTSTAVRGFRGSGPRR